MSPETLLDNIDNETDAWQAAQPDSHINLQLESYRYTTVEICNILISCNKGHSVRFRRTQENYTNSALNRNLMLGHPYWEFWDTADTRLIGTRWIGVHDIGISYRLEAIYQKRVHTNRY